MPKQKSRRKNYFIKKKFQANFFLKFTGLLLLEGLLIYALFIVIAKGTLTAAYRGADFTIRSTSQFFYSDFIVILFLVGAVIGVMGVFVFMYLSHRIGGALYRFEKTLETMQKGDFSQRVQLRRTDELLDLNSQLNLFLECMDHRMMGIKREVGKLHTIIKESEDTESSARIQESLKDLEKILKDFKTSS